MTNPAEGPVTEVAQFFVAPGGEDSFVVDYHGVKDNIATFPGCRSMRLTRGVENPNTFILMVEWDSVAAHEAFRATERFPAWRAGIGPHFTQAPHVEHYYTV